MTPDDIFIRSVALKIFISTVAAGLVSSAGVDYEMAAQEAFAAAEKFSAFTVEKYAEKTEVAP